MKKAEILAQMIDARYKSRRAFAEEIGLPPTTLQSMLTRGVGRSAIDNAIKVCRALGITVEELDEMASGETLNVQPGVELSNEENWTEEELQEIEKFKEFLRMKRKQKEN